MKNIEEIASKLERPQDVHKGQNGKVLVIGGSEKFTGASALAAESALRTGADLVKIFTAEKARPVVQGYSQDSIVESYGEEFDKQSLEKAEELQQWADITVIGPGLKADEETVKKFSETAENLVVDAEAIEACLDCSKNVFTPHSGEAELIRNNYGSLRSFAREKDNTVLMTSSTDKIYSKDSVLENRTGNSSMTAGGTGDVLTGIVAGLWSQGLERDESAYLAAYLNGKAGEKVSQKFGNGLKASDIPSEVAKVLKNL